jgi:hypothetical protein
MSKIQFSHPYKKLQGPDGKPVKTAKLLLVVPAMYETIAHSLGFLDYDTDNGLYALPYSTAYLLLLFQKPNGELFTTVRPQFNKYGDKRKYYEDLVDHQFQVVINQEVSHG